VKIGIDCRFWGTPTGLGRYSFSLVDGLCKTISEGIEMTLVLNRDHRPAVFPKGIRVTRLPSVNRVVWANLFAPWVIKQGQFDIYHALDNLSLPLFWPKGRTRYVLTIHDLIPLLFPESVTKQHRYYFRAAIRRLVELADAIIVDSNQTKARIRERFPLSVEKVAVIHPGVDSRRFAPIVDAVVEHRLRERYRLGNDPYLLYVGNIEPRKNLAVMISAYADMLKSPQVKSAPRLIIAGANGGLCDEVLALPCRLGLASRVKFIGVVADQDLPSLYANAAIFLFPSLYEGFGLPVLEAMASGTPVITSNISSLSEIAGDAALLVDPSDPRELAQAMTAVLSNKVLAGELRTKGLDRTKRFDWANTVRQTMQIYERVYRTHSLRRNA